MLNHAFFVNVMCKLGKLKSNFSLSGVPFNTILLPSPRNRWQVLLLWKLLMFCSACGWWRLCLYYRTRLNRRRNPLRYRRICRLPQKKCFALFHCLSPIFYRNCFCSFRRYPIRRNHLPRRNFPNQKAAALKKRQFRTKPAPCLRFYASMQQKALPPKLRRQHK